MRAFDKIKRELKKIWLGIDPASFNVAYVKSNILLLCRLSHDDLIEATESGKLFLSTNPEKKRSIIRRNRFLLGRLNRRVATSIYYSYIGFLYDFRYPFDAVKMDAFLRRKLTFVEKGIANLEKLKQCSWSLIPLREQIDKARRSFFLQKQMLRATIKATSAPSHAASVNEVQKALRQAIVPIKAFRGFSGTYIMRGTGYNRLGIFKPFDEELGAPHNPTGHIRRGPLGNREIRSAIRVGENLHREVAASVVDDALQLGIVPKTGYACLEDRGFGDIPGFLLNKKGPIQLKRGSFQTYIENCQGFSRMEPEAIALIPKEELQPLFLLDICIGHLDRHFSNILLSGQRIIAIDNGLSFPDLLCKLKDWHWKELPQLNFPFSKELREKLNRLEWSKLKKRLKKKCHLPHLALELMQERLALLKAAIAARLTVRQIVELFDRRHLIPLRSRVLTLEETADKIVAKFERKERWMRWLGWIWTRN